MIWRESGKLSWPSVAFLGSLLIFSKVSGVVIPYLADDLEIS